jgi:hypothetical protein
MSVFSAGAAAAAATVVVVVMTVAAAAASAAAPASMRSGTDAETRESMSPRVAAPTASVGPDRLILSITGCEELAPAEVREVMAAELRHSVIQIAGPNGDDGTPAGDTTTVSVACSAGEVTIAIHHPDGDRPAERTLSLLGTALVARQHLVALAVTELLFADGRRRKERFFHQAQQTQQPPKAVAPAAPVVVPPHSRPAPSAPEGSRTIARQARGEPVGHIEARGSALVFASAPVLWGGGIEYQHLVGARWGFGAQLELHHGLRQTALGDVSADVLAGAVTTFGEIATRHVTWQGGIGVDLGAARLRGTPGTGSAAAGGQLRRPWGGPLAQAAALLTPFGRLTVSLTVEVGWTLLPLRAQVAGDDSVELEGPWAGLSVGIGLNSIRSATRVADVAGDGV